MILCAMGTLAISFQRVFLEKGERIADFQILLLKSWCKNMFQENETFSEWKEERVSSKISYFHHIFKEKS